MKQGTQLIVHEPYGMMISGVRYHFLLNDPSTKRILLVYFDDSAPKADLIAISQSQFEDGLTKKIILAGEQQTDLPPWLAESGSRLTALKKTKENADGWVSRTAKMRCAAIAPAVRERRVILKSSHPIRELNRRARESRQNETRYRLWFFCYIAFNMDERVLMPPVSKMGKWDRFSESHVQKKYGCPSTDANRQRTYRVDEESKKKLIKGYHRFKSKGTPYTTIYTKTLTYIFKCKTAQYGRKKVIYHPNGEPIPSYGMFLYHVEKAVGKTAMQAVRFGEARIRQDAKVSEGKFTEQIANLMEQIEADGRYTKDLPRGLCEGSPQLPLCVVTGVDARSGLIAGIGFSTTGERADAYRMMLFCMAIDKVRFCRYFGIDITPDEWPSQGLPPFYISDRGPGAANDLIADFESRFPISQLTPSSEGQSKATVESSHPRNMKQVGTPTHVQSSLSVYEMGRREIFRAIQDNATSDALSRLTPDMILNVETPTPNAIWQYLDERGRSDAQGIPFDDAVRLFLKPVDLRVRQDGLYLYGQRYDSAELRESGILNSLIGAQASFVPGYALELAVRAIFVDIGGGIIELPAVFPALVDESEMGLTLNDLEEIDNQRRRIMKDFAEHKFAVTLDIHSRFETETAKPWDGGSRKRGRAKNRSSISRMEARDVQRERAKRSRK